MSWFLAGVELFPLCISINRRAHKNLSHAVIYPSSTVRRCTLCGRPCRTGIQPSLLVVAVMPHRVLVRAGDLILFSI